MSADEKGYQGWSNCETWCVALWLDNDQFAYEYWQEQAEEIGDNHKLARALKAVFEDTNPLAADSGLHSDLLRSALQEVDWYEIAESRGGEHE